jgi:hypothetical protein
MSNPWPPRVKRAVVETSPGVFAIGDVKYSTIDGEYVIHLDGECADHRWPSHLVEILDGDWN